MNDSLIEQDNQGLFVRGAVPICEEVHFGRVESHTPLNTVPDQKGVCDSTLRNLLLCIEAVR